MSRRKQSPPVAKPTGRRHFVEICKDILIVILTCSAVFLAWQTPLASQLRGWVTPAAPAVEPVARQPKEAAEPYGIAARNSMGLYGAIYDADQVDRAFHQFSSLLGEAFASAGVPERTSRRQWQTLLESPGVYCAFQGSPPVSLLSAWLDEEGPALEGNAQALLLSWDGRQVWLCWRDGDSYFRVPTQVVYEDHMDSVLESFNPNGAAFAYALAETDRAYSSIDPDVLVSMTAPQPRDYTASTPDLVGDGSALEQLLTALGFQSGVASAYEATGGLAINESGDRLRVGADGTVVFHAGEETRYPVAAQGGRPTGQEAALAAWSLLNRATAPWKGDTFFVLTGAEETADGWTVTFHGRLEGVPLRTGAEGWTASFSIAGDAVSDFTLSLRTYSPTGETSLLTSQRLAAAAMASDTYRDSGKRLILCYNDTGSSSLTAGWMAAE